MIPVYKPFLPHTPTAVLKALHRGDIAQGDYKENAAQALANILGVKHVLLTCNGTVATHLVYKSLKRRHPEVQRVIVPNNSYVAAWNAALFDGPQWKLIALDADLQTWNAKYETAYQFAPMDETTAIMVVHNIGSAVNIPALKRKFPHCPIIEDNCEGLFGRHEESMTGTESLCASLSFYGNKTITCGEGGALVTNDTELFNWLNRIYSQGQTKTKFVHDILAYNYRLSNIQAAVLCDQLRVVDEIRYRKEIIHSLYRAEFAGSGIYVQQVADECQHSHWMFGVRIPGKSYRDAEPWFTYHGIETRPMFYPLSRHAHLNTLLGAYIIPTGERVAHTLSEECIILPSFPELKSSEIEYICDRVKEFAQ